MDSGKSRESERGLWFKALSLVVNRQADIVPAGFYKMQDLMKILGKGRCRLQNLLKQLIENGLCEKKSFRIRQTYSPGIDRIQTIPHYRLDKKAITILNHAMMKK